MPIVDVHSHLGTHGLWQARHLADILSYHWVKVELARAAGHTFAEDLEPDDFVQQALPFIPAIRNTVNHYALMGILRDLYGLADRTLTAENWRAVDEAVRAHHQEAGWFDQVLDRARIARMAVAYNEGKPNPEAEFIPYENGEYLYAVDTVAYLRKIVGQDAPLPQTPEELQAAIASRIDGLARDQHIRALHVCPYPSERYPGWSYRPGGLPGAGRAATATPRRDSLARGAAPAHQLLRRGHLGRCRQAPPGDPDVPRLDVASGENTNEPSNISYWDPDFLQTHTRCSPSTPTRSMTSFWARASPATRRQCWPGPTLMSSSAAPGGTPFPPPR